MRICDRCHNYNEVKLLELDGLAAKDRQQFMGDKANAELCLDCRTDFRKIFEFWLKNRTIIKYVD